MKFATTFATTTLTTDMLKTVTFRMIAATLCVILLLTACGREREETQAAERATPPTTPVTAPAASGASDTSTEAPAAPQTGDEEPAGEQAEEPTAAPIEEQTEGQAPTQPEAQTEAQSEAQAEVQPTEAQPAEDSPTEDQQEAQAPAADAANVCAPANIQYVGLGGEVDWSPDGTQLLFDRRDAEGIYQLYMMAADGSNERCLSCTEVEGGPALDRHKGFASWHPSGAYLVTQAEMARHIPIKALSEPGRGGWNDLYALTPDGQQWWQLTEYSGLQTTGVLNPRFSADGSKLLWAEKMGRASDDAPFGQWQLVVADFVVDDSGPHLENLVSMRPGEGRFYEAHGFNRDGTKILFTSDIGLDNPFALDVFLYTLETGELVNLTNSPEEWDEHAAYARHADKIAFMSSQCCEDYDPDDFGIFNLGVLQAEVYVINADGSDAQQVTHFNTPGAPEYAEENSAATVISWHPDGTRLAVAQLFVGNSYDDVEGRKLWIVDFNGVCQ